MITKEEQEKVLRYMDEHSPDEVFHPSVVSVLNAAVVRCSSKADSIVKSVKLARKIDAAADELGIQGSDRLLAIASNFVRIFAESSVESTNKKDDVDGLLNKLNGKDGK